MLGRDGVCLMCAVAFASFAMPVTAHATIKEGRPELYENGKLVAGKENASHTFTGDIQQGYGELALETENGPEGFECVNVGFGAGWNEGSPLHAVGEILAWDASGHTPNEEHPKLSANCRPESTRAYLTDENFALSEETEGKLILAKRNLSTPWNVELTCGIREGAFQGIVKIGVPTSEFPSASKPCPAKAGEAEEEKEIEGYTKERTERKGCYKTNPAPAGCIRVTIVDPGGGGEFAFGGTLHPQSVNGVHNGLTPTHWSFEGSRSGVMQCEFPEGCTAEWTTFGEVKDIGYTSIQLIQGK